MEKKTCAACKHFQQHYVLVGTRYIAVMCGHCIFPRVKYRAPQIPCCNNFLSKKTPAAEETPF